MAQYVDLPGTKRGLLPRSRPAGPVDRSQIESLTIRVRGTEGSARLDEDVYEQALKPLAERTYVSRAEYAETYGATAEDLDRVERFAQQHNLTVTHRSAAERSIVLRGSLGDLLAAFPTQVGMYHHSSGPYRGRTTGIRIPAQLDGVVTGVFGYDTRPRKRTPHRGKPALLSGPGGANGVPATFFAQRYNFPGAQNGTRLDGTGQTIAIIELGGGFRTSDLGAFFNEIGMPMPSVTAVSVDHAGNKPSTPDSADGEVMLDIEVAGAVAPGAKIAVYFAPNNGDKGFIDAISAAIHDTERNPSVISISWGGPESANDEQANKAFHEVFAAAAQMGVTICVASGDHGTADQDAADWDGQIHVDHPAADPLVLACGGTQIDANNGDVVWNDGTPFDVNVPGGGGWASGGGISLVFPVPSYQAGAGLPKSIVNGQAGRGVPDIAMSATNYFTRVDTFESASGGTSAVAPLMASLIALLNQAKKKNVGFVNPFLYANVAKGVVKDVTGGDNAIFKTAQGYNAGPGWDACTGLGTPDGTAILNNL